jgi:ubiquinone/menaquinone biosynthesis C-methylase UbiE
VTVEHFDTWYAAMTPQSARDRLWQEHLGLPPEMVSSSLLSLDGLREIQPLLDLGPGKVLLDLACGRGGYGMWLARDTGCEVVGVDFSAVAVEDAQQRVGAFGLDGRASYVVGDLLGTGLDDASVDAVLCVDAVQFAGDPEKACREVLRVLRPGGAAAFTAWEALDPDDAELPDRIRRLDLHAALPAAGFTEVRVEDRQDWHEAEQRFWDAVGVLEPGEDQGLRDAVDEGRWVRTVMLPRVRRVLATGRAPL